MQEFIAQHVWIIYLLAVWTIPWKGIALWKAAKNNHRIWFVVILILNTLAVLDIIFIVFFSKEKNEENDETSKNSPKVLSNGKRIV